MSEPDGTQEIWQVSKKSAGKPPTFETPEELEELISAYLSWVQENPLWEVKAFGTGLMLKVPKKRYPTASGCAIFCGVSPRTWRSWKAPGHHLKDAVEYAEEVMLQMSHNAWFARPTSFAFADELEAQARIDDRNRFDHIS